MTRLQGGRAGNSATRRVDWEISGPSSWNCHVQMLWDPWSLAFFSPRLYFDMHAQRQADDI